MAKNANEPLPGFALFITKRAAQVAENNQMMRQASLPKRATAKSPAAGPPGESQLHRAGRLTLQASAQSELVCSESERTLHGAVQQAHACAIDEPEFLVLVEREDRKVDFLHHGSQEGRSFQRTEALLAQRLAERVYFDHDLAHGILSAGPASTHREIFFAQRRKKIRKGLEGENDAVFQGKGETEPKDYDEEGQCPGGA